VLAARPVSVIDPVAVLQVVGLIEVNPPMTGVGFTVTDCVVRLLSQPVVVSSWLTYQVVVPAAVEDGTGAVELPVPPVAAVYQSAMAPVAVVACSATAVCPWQ
jgi:hypothetical protein